MPNLKLLKQINNLQGGSSGKVCKYFKKGKNRGGVFVTVFILLN